MSWVLGIDPGLDGACCLLGPQSAQVFDLPSKQDEATGRRIDGAALAQVLQKQIPVDVPVRVCIEALSAGGVGRRGNQFSTVGSQFWSQSAIVTTLELLGLEVAEHVTPVRWKKLFGLQGKKDDAPAAKRETRLLAAELYPVLADQLQRQNDHNRADAVLIAHWFRKVRAND